MVNVSPTVIQYWLIQTAALTHVRSKTFNYGSCDDFSENSERSIRVLASCRIIIFRMAVKQRMTSLQDDINIICGVALLGV